jgi:hypothetical protein
MSFTDQSEFPFHLNPGAWIFAALRPACPGWAILDGFKRKARFFCRPKFLPARWLSITCPGEYRFGPAIASSTARHKAHGEFLLDNNQIFKINDQSASLLR